MGGGCARWGLWRQAWLLGLDVWFAHCKLVRVSCVLPFRRAKARAEMMKRREAGFDTNTANDKLPKYNALFDSNLRHFFENRNVQTHLYKTGLVSVRWAVGWTFGCACSSCDVSCCVWQIDRGGRIIDLDRNKAKLAIIEQEFTNAQKEEEARLREEEEMRVCCHSLVTLSCDSLVCLSRVSLLSPSVDLASPLSSPLSHTHLLCLHLLHLLPRLHPPLTHCLLPPLYNAAPPRSATPCVTLPQRRVQKKRHEALEKARRQEKMLKMKEDRRIQKEIVKVQRGEHAITKPKPRRRRRKVTHQMPLRPPHPTTSHHIPPLAHASTPSHYLASAAAPLPHSPLTPEALARCIIRIRWLQWRCSVLHD